MYAVEWTNKFVAHYTATNVNLRTMPNSGLHVNFLGSKFDNYCADLQINSHETMLCLEKESLL